MTTAVMQAYLQPGLLPSLRVGDLLILDKLSVQHAARLTQRLTQQGCRGLLLPADSPDCWPIEKALAKSKTLLRRLRAQTVDALLEALAQARDASTPWHASGYFTNARFFNLD